jgi:hypothetical protein
MKRSLVVSSLVGVYLVAVALCIGQMRAAQALPGVPIADEMLDLVRAAGCGQFASTQGQPPCFGAYNCPTDPVTSTCVNSTLSCPACGPGALNVICVGADGSDNLCTQYTVGCCIGPQKCALTNDSSNPCQCLAGFGAAIGTRSLVAITPNSGCSGGGGGGGTP